MTYITSIEELGIEKGRIEGLREGIILALELKFGDAAQPTEPSIELGQDLGAGQAHLGFERHFPVALILSRRGVTELVVQGFQDINARWRRNRKQARKCSRSGIALMRLSGANFRVPAARRRGGHRRAVDSRAFRKAPDPRCVEPYRPLSLFSPRSGESHRHI